MALFEDLSMGEDPLGLSMIGELMDIFPEKESPVWRCNSMSIVPHTGSASYDGVMPLHNSLVSPQGWATQDGDPQALQTLSARAFITEPLGMMLAPTAADGVSACTSPLSGGGSSASRAAIGPGPAPPSQLSQLSQLSQPHQPPQSPKKPHGVRVVSGSPPQPGQSVASPPKQNVLVEPITLQPQAMATAQPTTIPFATVPFATADHLPTPHVVPLASLGTMPEPLTAQLTAAALTHSAFLPANGAGTKLHALQGLNGPMRGSTSGRARSQQREQQGDPVGENGDAPGLRPCAVCRSAKVRCNRADPCGRCSRLGIFCYPPEVVQRGRPSRQRIMMRAFMAQQQAQKEAALAHLNATLGTGGAQAGDEGLYAALGVVGRGAKQLPGTESTNTTRIAPERQVHGGGFFFSGGSDASPAQSEQAEHSVLMAANDDDMFMDDDNGGSFLGSDDGELSPTASEAAAVPATSPTSGSDHSYGDFAAMHAGPLLAAAPVLSKLVVEPGALTAQVGPAAASYKPASQPAARADALKETKVIPKMRPEEERALASAMRVCQSVAAAQRPAAPAVALPVTKPAGKHSQLASVTAGPPAANKLATAKTDAEQGNNKNGERNSYNLKTKIF